MFLIWPFKKSENYFKIILCNPLRDVCVFVSIRNHKMATTRKHCNNIGPCEKMKKKMIIFDWTQPVVYIYSDWLVPYKLWMFCQSTIHKGYHPRTKLTYSSIRKILKKMYYLKFQNHLTKNLAGMFLWWFLPIPICFFRVNQKSKIAATLNKEPYGKIIFFLSDTIKLNRGLDMQRA